MFKPEQLTEIKQSSLARVICDNSDDIEDITRNVFILPKKQGGYVSCSKIPQIDLRFWTECSHGQNCFLIYFLIYSLLLRSLFNFFSLQTVQVRDDLILSLGFQIQYLALEDPRLYRTWKGTACLRLIS